jgi:hypothetical protein
MQAAIALFLEIPILRKTHVVRSPRHIRLVPGFEIDTVSPIADNNANITICPVRMFFDRQDTGFRLILRQQSIKIHMELFSCIYGN